MSYFDSQYSRVKQPMKCRRCGEIGLRYPHEKCQCQRKLEVIKRDWGRKI